MTQKTPLKNYPGYNWIIVDPQMLGGSPTIKGTRLSVELVLQSLASGMTPQQINEEYGSFPVECIPEVLRFAANLAKEFPNVAA